MKIRAVFFDAGYTLLRPSPSVEEVCVRVLRQRGLSVERHKIDQAMPEAQAFFRLARRLDGQHIWAAEETIRRFWTDYYEKLFQAVGLDGELRPLADAVYEEFSSPAWWRPYPEVEAVLGELRQRGYILGIISDWGVQLTAILHELGLSRYLDFAVVSALVGAAKPNGHVFQLALRRAQVRPEEALHVGDDYPSDILGARAAGIVPVFINRHAPLDHLDCAQVHDLTGVLTLVDNCAADAFET